jgi:predicted DCC family thiol-disulfide oxidoreductase YuxK
MYKTYTGQADAIGKGCVERQIRMKSFQVFFDGDCPLCVREISLLRRLDRAGRIEFTNIADPGFDAASVGKTHEDLMAQIHGRLPEGSWVTGVEVFRQLYAAVGFETLVAMTRWRPIAWCLDAGYRWFAKNRLRLTGRPACESGACRVPASASS